MRNRAFLKVVLLGLLTFALVPGLAGAASQGQDLTGMLASSAAERATAVSGPIISITPAFHDFGRQAVGGLLTQSFTISNTGAMDLHISGATETNPGIGFSIVGLPATVVPGTPSPFSVNWLVTGSGPVSDNFTINSDASNGPFTILVAGRANNCPAFSTGGTYNIYAFLPFTWVGSATDPENDPITWSASNLPVGASFDAATATFMWTPISGDAGAHSINICASDGLCTYCQTLIINVTAPNNPPVANAGGPYSGLTGFPVSMSGAASTDPDFGQTATLGYKWNFGDGYLGVGVTVSHTYAAAGSYIVSLTVTDTGTPILSNSATTTARVENFIAATIVQQRSAAAVIKTQGNGVQLYGLQMVARPITDVDVTTLRMSTTSAGAGTVSQISPASSKKFSIGDINNDLIGDLDMWFRYSDQGNLLSNVTNGTMVTIVITARTISDNVLVRGTIDLTKKGSAAVTSAAAPNPFKPETSISYSVERGGSVSIRIFSVGGQLVRSLREENATAGTHEVRWNGRDDGGRAVPSGIYFVSVRQGSEASTTRVVLAR